MISTYQNDLKTHKKKLKLQNKKKIYQKYGWTAIPNNT